MALLVADCPRCGAQKMTLDILQSNRLENTQTTERIYETFAICRQCRTSTVFVVLAKRSIGGLLDNASDRISELKVSINPYFDILGFVSTANHARRQPPEHLPEDIDRAFREGAACLAIECFNAAATMFRLCADILTKPLLPPLDEANPQPNKRVRRDLGLRLRWLFENGRLPRDLEDLAKCIREDANDGAHVGSLTAADAEDVQDFTYLILERLITEPRRLQLAQERRSARRSQN